jgi:hypothetical protein
MNKPAVSKSGYQNMPVQQPSMPISKTKPNDRPVIVNNKSKPKVEEKPKLVDPR